MSCGLAGSGQLVSATSSYVYTSDCLGIEPNLLLRCEQAGVWMRRRKRHLSDLYTVAKLCTSTLWEQINASKWKFVTETHQPPPQNISVLVCSDILWIYFSGKLSNSLHCFDGCFVQLFIFWLNESAPMIWKSEHSRKHCCLLHWFVLFTICWLRSYDPHFSVVYESTASQPLVTLFLTI